MVHFEGLGVTRVVLAFAGVHVYKSKRSMKMPLKKLNEIDQHPFEEIDQTQLTSFQRKKKDKLRLRKRTILRAGPPKPFGWKWKMAADAEQ